MPINNIFTENHRDLGEKDSSPYFKIQTKDNQQFIFDIIRKKYVALTPEEWVRQHFLHFLITEKEFPKALISVEKGIVYNQMQKRYDIVAFNNKGIPVLMVECKAPKVKITQKAFDQVARYNKSISANYIAVTNGSDHYVCRIDHDNQSFEYIQDLPLYSEL